MRLMTEHNRDRLLHLILQHVMRLTFSDAGALFLLERDSDGAERLRIKLVRVESVAVNLTMEEAFPVDSSSLAGHVATTKQPVVVDDIRNLPAGAPYAVNPFAEQRGYWIKSMMSVPMIDQREEVVGVLQLANRKLDPAARILTKDDAYRYTVSYGERDVQFGRSLAGHAAVLIENAQLYAQIDALLESFRNPVTRSTSATRLRPVTPYALPHS
jgi:GAF domain-containing protein